jgi:hypothetical protein
MAKLGWIVAALAALLVTGAAYTSAPVDDSKKLDEIKALLEESNRLQRIDVHPRRYKAHALYTQCDFGKTCDALESRANRHDLDFDVLKPHHSFVPECMDKAACKEQEVQYQRRNAELEEFLKKSKGK